MDTQRYMAAIARYLRPSDPKQSLLPFIPRPAKWLVLFILLVNSKSLPFVWHFRVFKPILAIQLRAWLTMKIYGPKAGPKWLTDNSLVNQSPFDHVTLFKTRATLDDCDWNGHLNNSAFGKNLDHARSKGLVELFPGAFAHKCCMALGGAHYLFVKEIPANTNYEIRLSIGGWDHKWIHLIAFFVTYSSKPRPTTQTNGSISPNGGTSLSAAAQHALASLPTNAVLHCISVSSYCFKHGRITVPPRVALVASGFGDATKGRWTRLQELRKAKKLVPLIRGGWREEEDGSGKFKDFWQLEEFEETRLGRVHWLGKLREGLENYGTGARAE